jgi:hypothetical protein
LANGLTGIDALIYNEHMLIIKVLRWCCLGIGQRIGGVGLVTEVSKAQIGAKIPSYG